MPNIHAAKKALRHAKKRAARNLVVKKRYKEAVKGVRKAIGVEGQDVAEMMRLAQKALDKAAKRGVIKKNTASRKLSRLAKALAGNKS